MQLTQPAIGLVLASFLACTRAADLQDQFRMSEYQLAIGEKLRLERSAPIIVAGTVLAVDDVGTPKASPGDPRIKTQLTRIGLNVEQTIKGNQVPRQIDFYYFTYSTENTRDLGVPRYIPEVGQRRIYFLKPWEGTYRSIGDVTNYTLTVTSGTHGSSFCQAKEPGCCIAEILLELGPDRETDSFERDLWPAAYAAGELCSPRKARDLLKELTRNPDPRIADRATDTIPILEQWWPELKQLIQ